MNEQYWPHIYQQPAVLALRSRNRSTFQKIEQRQRKESDKRKQTDRVSAFMPHNFFWPEQRGGWPCNFFLSSNLITLQNLVTASHTVCAHVVVPKIFGDAVPRPLGIVGMPDHLETCPSPRVTMPIFVALGQTIRTDICWKKSFTFHLSRSLRINWTQTDRSATYDFLLVIYSNRRPISYRCWGDKRQFRSNIANFPTGVYLTPLLRKSTAEFCNGGLGLKRLDWCPYQNINVTICAFV